MTNEHGGKRLGAGRPRTGAMPVRAIRMTDTEYELVKRLLTELRSSQGDASVVRIENSVSVQGAK